MSVNPLMIKSDPENRNMRIETVVIVPRHIDDSESGGSCQFILPHRGYLSGDSRLVLPATCANDAYQYCPNAGVHSLISQATMRVGDVVVAQVDSANQLYSMRQNLNHLEKREQVQHVLNGTSNSFETCSGGRRDGFETSAEIFAGQMRLVGSGGYDAQLPAQVPGNAGARPCLMDADLADAYKLKTFYKDKADEAGTPEFTVELSTLFPGFFGQRLQLPLQLINMEDEVSIELVFSDNSKFGSNERAVFASKYYDASESGACIAVAQRDIHGANGAIEAPANGFRPANQTGLLASPTGGNGTGLRVKFDTDANGLPENLRVVDGGSGYEPGDQLEIASDVAAPNDQPYGLSVASSIGAGHVDLNGKFTILAGGAGYDVGEATLKSKTNEGCDIPITLQVNAGAVSGFTLSTSSVENAKFLGTPGSSRFEIEQDGGANAVVMFNNSPHTVTCADIANGPFVLGELVQDGDGAKSRVLAVDGNGNPTTLDLLSGQDYSGAGPFALQALAQADRTVNVSAAAQVANFDAPVSVGLGGGLGLYDTLETGGKINIQTSAVRLATDLIFYEDGRAEQDAKEMMSQGINMIYTEFRNVKTTLHQDQEPASYGSVNEHEHVRLIGFSNEVLRTLLMSHYPIGTQSDEDFENYNMSKVNPLLLKYCSRDSLAEDGVSLQLVLNSVPRFPSPINFNPHFYVELASVFGSPFYIPHGMYNGATSCKQRDNEALTANSQQPGFSTDSSATQATLRYELNERKAGMSNQNFMGINQKYLRGMGKYMGIDLKKMPGNFQNNGVAIGSQAVEIDYNYKSTYNPYYSGNGEMCIFGEVERIFQLVKGRVFVTTSSM